MSFTSLFLLALSPSLSGAFPSGNTGALMHSVCAAASATPTREQTRVFLARLSITPETACAAGVTVSEVPVLFELGADTADSLASVIQSTNENVANARAQLALTRRQAGVIHDASLDDSLVQAESALQAALAAQSEVLQSAFATIIAPLPESTRALLTTLRVNSGQPVPVEFRVTLRSPEQWQALASAIQHVRSRENCGLPPIADRQSLVSAATSEQAVYAAKQRLISALGAVRTAWSGSAQP